MVAHDDGSIDRLAHSSTSIWLMQCNPTKSDIHAEVRTHGLPQRWCVKRHLGEIASGDRVVLWLSGRRAGAYALGFVGDDTDGPNTAELAHDTAQAPLELIVDLFDEPVLRSRLLTDPRFAAESIIRQPFAANPHRVSPHAFDALLDALAERDRSGG